MEVAKSGVEEKEELHPAVEMIEVAGKMAVAGELEEVELVMNGQEAGTGMKLHSRLLVQPSQDGEG